MCCLPSSMKVSGGLDNPPICEYHRPFPVAASHASTFGPLLTNNRPPAVESRPELPPLISFRHVTLPVRESIAMMLVPHDRFAPVPVPPSPIEPRGSGSIR